MGCLCGGVIINYCGLLLTDPRLQTGAGSGSNLKRTGNALQGALSEAQRVLSAYPFFSSRYMDKVMRALLACCAFLRSLRLLTPMLPNSSSDNFAAQYLDTLARRTAS